MSEETKGSTTAATQQAAAEPANKKKKWPIVVGIIVVVIAVAGIVGCTRLHSIRLVVYVYAAGLVYKSFVRIASAFRRTAIVFVQ